MLAPRVLVIIATFGRPESLRALLGSLSDQGGELAGVIIVDNAAGAETATIAQEAPMKTSVLTPRQNLGCGGGVARGLTAGLAAEGVTHFWMLDDDVLALSGVLRNLLSALEQVHAHAAVPLVTDGCGHLGWFPGPLPQPAWDIIRAENMTPEGFRSACGLAPLAWTWAPWPSLLVSRTAVATVGLPRSDYWFQGEDLEWTLRLSAHFRCVLAPAAECRHLLPHATDRRREFLKSALMLQNNFYTSVHLKHGHRLRRHAPGNLWRFLRREQVSPNAIRAAWLAFWRGAICGRPAGQSGGNGFRNDWIRSTTG